MNKSKHISPNYLNHRFIQLLLLNLRNSSCTSYFKSRDVTLDYKTYNENATDIIPMVMCHGIFGNKNNWRFHSKFINENNGNKVIAYDAVNHGSSSHHEDMSYPNMAHDLVNLLDKLEIEKAILLGHSMGGKTVMTSALTHPDRVDKLIVVDSSPVISPSMGEVLTFIQTMNNIDMAKITSRKMVDEILERVAKSASLRSFLMTNLYFSGGKYNWRINLKALENNYSYIHSFPFFEGDVKYEKPTLFIGGGRSNYITEKVYPLIYNFFPIAKIEHIPNAGHWLHSEKPNEFLEIILKFIR